MGFKKSLKGCILSDAANAYETWFIRPNKLRMSVVFLGGGKFLMASMKDWQGPTVVGPIAKLAKSVSNLAKANFVGLPTTPLWPQVSSQSMARQKLDAIPLSLGVVRDHKRLSYTILVLLGMSVTIIL